MCARAGVVCKKICSSVYIAFLMFYAPRYRNDPQLFVFLFNVLSVAVFVIRDRFVKKPTCA